MVYNFYFVYFNYFRIIGCQKELTLWYGKHEIFTLVVHPFFKSTIDNEEKVINHNCFPIMVIREILRNNLALQK